MSWKKYGGTNKLDKLNNISVNTIVTDNFTLKQFYIGDWDICGGLSVKNNAIVNGNLQVIQDLSVNGNININGELNVYETNIYGNIFIANSAYIKDYIYLDANGSTLFSGVNGKFGLNTPTPQATLDISSNLEKSIDIHSSSVTNKNVIARNLYDQGITVNVEPTQASINFYVDGSINNGIPSGRLVYDRGGNFTIDVSNVVKFKPRVAFTQDTGKGFIADERVIIYDNSSATVPYLPAIYGNPGFKTGTGLNLVAGDNSSNVFIRLGTETGAGVAFGGGSGPSGEIMGIMAIVDTSSNKYPAINVFSNKTLTQNLATSIAVNKHNVLLDGAGANKYAMDINGPCHVAHQETLFVNDVSFDIYAQTNVGNIVYAVGASVQVSGNSNHQYISKSTDGGYTWTTRRLVDDSTGTPYTQNLEQTPSVFRAIGAYDANNIVIAGDNGFIFKSANGGTTWTQLYGGTIWPQIIGFGIGALYISSYPRLVFGTNTTPGQIYSSRTWMTDIENKMGPYDTSINNITGIHGQLNNTVVVGQNGLQCYRTYESGSYTNFGPLVISPNPLYGVHSYFDINGFGHAVAVGQGILYYSHNIKWDNTTKYNAVTWSSIAIPGVTLKKVRVLDASNAIAVGNSGAVYYSVDGFATWTRAAINNERLNALNLTSLSIINANDFVISGASGELFNLWNPYLLNRTNANVVEASGNMVVSGDIHINDSGQLLTNNQVFNILPTNATTINIGSTGNTNINNNLNISGNAAFSGWITQW